MPSYSLEPNKVYNVSLFGASIIGAELKSVKNLGSVAFAIAKRYTDIVSIHAQLLAHLPVGTSQDPSQLTYFLFEDSNAEINAYASEWISRQPEEVNSSTYVLTISNTNATAMQLVKEFLLQNGFNNFNMVKSQ